MALVRVGTDASFETVTPAEHQNITAKLLWEVQRDRYRGVKFLSLPQLQGTAAAGALALGYGTQRTGPGQGFVWSITKLVVSGLTAGATPDVVNFFVNHETAAVPWWQLNGNSFGETFGRGQMMMNPGDFLLCYSLGTFAATGQITVGGQVLEVPAEQAGKLI